MPWRIKREVYLILLGVALLTLAIVVLVLNKDASTELLAAAAIVGGLAVVLVSLPDHNGKDGDH